jgi:hypothetical protein
MRRAKTSSRSSSNSSTVRAVIRPSCPEAALNQSLKPFVILLLVLALVFFIIAAAIAGGMISASGAGWLVPGGLASLAFALLLAQFP